MRRILGFFGKNLSIIAKKTFVLTFLYANMKYNFLQKPIYCRKIPDLSIKNIQKIEQKTIKIKQNGEIVAHAYYFTPKCLVAIGENFQPNKLNAKYEYYLGEQKLKGSFKFIGNYQNLAFIQPVLSVCPRQIRNLFSRQMGMKAMVVKKNNFMSVKEGVFITYDSGFGIIDSDGEIGSLVVNNEGIQGIVVQKGSKSDQGFLRFIKWSNLQEILKFIKNKSFYLGISAQSTNQGVVVVRISPDSPLNGHLVMGDIITSANGHKFRTAQGLQRICIQSNGRMHFTVLRENNSIQLEANI